MSQNETVPSIETSLELVPSSNTVKIKCTTINLDHVEELYSRGLPHFQAARGLGMSATTWSDIRNSNNGYTEVDIPGVLAAIQKGEVRICNEALQDLRNHSKKNVIATLALLNQPRIGDMAQHTKTSIEGSITINVVRQRIGDDGEVIDITPRIEE